MNQNKGFTLIEVLLSLILLSSMALVLVEYQWQTRLLLTQWVARMQASQQSEQKQEQTYYHE